MIFKNRDGVLKLFLKLFSVPSIIIIMLFLYILQILSGYIGFSIFEFIRLVFEWIILPVSIFVGIVVSIYRIIILKQRPFNYKFKNIVIYIFILLLLVIFTFFIHEKPYKYSLKGDCSSKGEYSIGVLNNKKKEMITRIITYNKKLRKERYIEQGGSKLEADKYIESFQNEYKREYEKFDRYCQKNTMYCNTTISVDYEDSIKRKIFFNPKSVESSISYTFDKESLLFFNSINNNYKKINMVGYESRQSGDYICDAVRYDILNKGWFRWE